MEGKVERNGKECVPLSWGYLFGLGESDERKMYILALRYWPKFRFIKKGIY